MAKQIRLHHSELTVPGNGLKMIEKAQICGAHTVFIDFEDAVVPAEKNLARTKAIKVLGVHVVRNPADIYATVKRSLAG